MGTVEDGLRILADAALIVGHNVIEFDVPAIQKLHPSWKPKGIVRDTIVLARLLWPSEQIKEWDFRNKKFPKKLAGRYSLEAFGYRLGNYKGDFKGPWDKWTPEMQEYCEQDVEVTHVLWQRCQRRLAGEDDPQKEPWSEECVELEHQVATIVARQTRHGVCFDEEKAAALHAKLVEHRDRLYDRLQEIFPPRERVFIPKASNRKIGYIKGQPVIKRTPFNPGSEKQVAARLIEAGWEPTEYTKNGTPKLDDAILSELTHPAIKLLVEYRLVEKRLGAIADGKEAWLKCVRNGRIHGRITTNGAVTGRMTHSRPNTANVPGIVSRKTGKPQLYGRECRELFRASPGKVLVGCDADALEGRCQAHFLYPFDGGDYARMLLEGKKEDGSDFHSQNAKALGVARDPAKTWFYAYIYGAADYKLGLTLIGKKAKKRVLRAGAKARAQFLERFPAFDKLTQAVQKVLRKRNWLRGLDGRKVFIRSDHAALNTLLQSAGALVMKKALVILDTKLQAADLVPGDDYEFVLNVHDEWQIETLPKNAEFVGQLAADAIRLAGEHFQFRCPLKGNYKIGETWADTH